MALHSLGTIAGVVAMFGLVVAGLALTIYGLRNDLREKRRSYRRRGPRPRDPNDGPAQPAQS